MPRWTPMRNSYPSLAPAEDASHESLAYVVLHAPGSTGLRDGIAVLDTDPQSPTLGRIVGALEFPHAGNGLRHFGWSTCRPAHKDGDASARRFLLAPGRRSSRIHVVDTQPDPRAPRLVKVIDGPVLGARSGYAAPVTVRATPDGVAVSALGAADGEGPGGIIALDPSTFEVRGAWESARGPQSPAYDSARHERYGIAVTSEWGAPRLVDGGFDPKALLAGGYGHALHVWDLERRTHRQVLELGAEHQAVLALRPVHRARRAYGFASVMISTADLSSSVFLWYLDRDADGAPREWKARKVISIPALPADPATLPPALRPFGAVPPLVTDLALSMDDRWLHVACWGSGELRQYDVSDPFDPVHTGTISLGGGAARRPSGLSPGGHLAGGPQSVEASRDGRRLYVTSSFDERWDAQVHPGATGWLARVEVGAEGGLTLDPSCLVRFPDGQQPRQVRLLGGDATSDTPCGP